VLFRSVASATSLGFQALRADLYWLSALQYFGRRENAKVAFRGLANYLELIVGLAPDFKEAYRFGGAVLPWPTSNGWKNVPETVSLLERGTERFPEDWFMRLMLAYNYSSGLQQYKKAGEQLLVASKYPGAPPYLPKLAARLFVAAGDFDGAQALAERVAAETDDPVIREMMLRRAREVEAEHQLSALQSAADAFRSAQGRAPSSLADLVATGFLREIPADPLGGSYDLDPATGQVTSSSLKERLQVYEQKR
jgi:hypothetical protein